MRLANGLNHSDESKRQSRSGLEAWMEWRLLMDVQLILKELHEAGVLEGHMQELKTLTGGTSSEVIAVMDGAKPRYVIKQNDPVIVEAEAEFLQTYSQIEKLTRLVYVDPLLWKEQKRSSAAQDEGIRKDHTGRFISRGSSVCSCTCSGNTSTES
ncbi:UNVERIFIED_CONTAM: hypothetical protein ABIC26_000803 [Paenibacillus sp. PvR008]